MSKEELCCVDLFAGAGGLGLGLQRAGYKVSGVVEIDDAAGATYSRNFLADDRRVFTALGSESGDIKQIDFGQVGSFLKEQGIDRVDLIAGGPPCQGFSKAGRGKLNHLDDDFGAFSQDSRNSLIFDFCRAVRVLRPRAVLVENVTGIFNLAGENHANLICRELTACGYRVRATVLNAAWYGVPQNRERFFLIGIAEDVPEPHSWFPEPKHHGRERRRQAINRDLQGANFDNPDWVEAVHPAGNSKPPVTVGEAFADLPAFTAHLDEPGYRCGRAVNPPRPYSSIPRSTFAQQMRTWPGLEESREVRDHFCRNTPRDFRIFREMKQGDLYPDAVRIAAELYRKAVDSWDSSRGHPQPRPEEFIPPYPLGNFSERWQKLYFNRPSWTVTAHLSKDCYSHIHPDDEQARTITVREAARLQSFPDNFDFVGNTGECFRQIGNAVPPLLGCHLASHIRGLLEKKARRRPKRTWSEMDVPSSLWESPAAPVG